MGLLRPPGRRALEYRLKNSPPPIASWRSLSILRPRAVGDGSTRSVPGESGREETTSRSRRTRVGVFARAATISCSSSAEEGSSQCTSSIQRSVGRPCEVRARIEETKSYCRRLKSWGVGARGSIVVLVVRLGKLAISRSLSGVASPSSCSSPTSFSCRFASSSSLVSPARAQRKLPTG